MKNKSLLFIALALFLCCCNINTFAITQNKNISTTNLCKKEKSSVQVFSYKHNQISITKNDMYLMAQVVFAESRAEPYSGKVAVASVILNRLLHPQFPKTIEGVIKQKGAFSCVVNGRLNVTPDEQSFKAVSEALKGKDPTNEAVFFYNPKIATSRWMFNVKKSNVKLIGNHIFFVTRS